MIDCPECDKPMSGRKCSCGYFMRGAAPATRAHNDIKDRGDAEHLLASKKWLREHGITHSGMSTAERMKACADNRKSIVASPFARQGVAWAVELIRRAEDEPIPRIAVAMAEAALKRSGLAVEDDLDIPY